MPSKRVRIPNNVFVSGWALFGLSFPTGKSGTLSYIKSAFQGVSVKYRAVHPSFRAVSTFVAWSRTGRLFCGAVTSEAAPERGV